MSGLVKVYNKGIRPIVWKSTLKGREAIHPGKYDVFSKELADQIISKFSDAVSEADFNKSRKPEKPERVQEQKPERDIPKGK